MAPRGETTITQLRRGVLEFCVLALLREGERYSFDLVRALEDADGLVTSERTLYPSSGACAVRAWSTGTWRESATGPPRRDYRITKDGDAALEAFAGQWAQFRESVEAEQPAAQHLADRRGLREWAAVILLPLGGFVFGVGWLVGLILLWSSRLWTTRDKLIGTLVIPGGLATGLFVFLWLNVAVVGTSTGGPSTALSGV